MTVTDHEVLHETAERLAPHPTTWAAPASTTSAAPGEPRPRSQTPAGRLTPRGCPAGPEGGGHLGPVPAAFPSTGGRGAVPMTAPAPGPSTTPPDPHDPDRVITDWYAREPDPRVPGWHVVGWLVLAAALWALLILVGYDVWDLLGLRMPWAA